MFTLLRSNRSSTGWFRLLEPAALFVATRLDEVRPLLRRLEGEAASGRWVAGWLAYEAGAAFEAALPSQGEAGPLAVFSSFARAEEVVPDEVLPPPLEAPLPRWQARVEAASQQQALIELGEAIRAGVLYQANLSFRCDVDLGGAEPLSLFHRLIRAQPVPHAACFDFGHWSLLSLSPELFLERRGSRILSRPMKGTCPRIASWEEDEAVRSALAGDLKSRAENVMIVDLMRNDLSRICRHGSVKVEELFRVDRYATLHQMVSDVVGELEPGIGLEAILAACFPPGSVTGAPKIQACQIIRRLETEARGAYTGIAGILLPDGDFDFNVCIRTLEKTASGWQLGLGSGVVADSSPRLEWQECLLKGRFLRAEPAPEELFTTLRWQDGRPHQLLSHLRRLRRSCLWFQRPFPAAALFRHLRLWRQTQKTGCFRVRLAVRRDGSPSCRSEAVENPGWGGEPVRLHLAAEVIDAEDPWLQHKTSRRQVYDRALAAARAAACGEALLCNHRGEIAEGAISSIFVRDAAGRWATPPLSAGILPGIWRAGEIRRLGAEERVLTLADLQAATALRIGNSFRGGADAILA